ncbi:hypothetical protein ADIARSV_0516 [Arcticibacter svalbardensis MN12-7]|uniref:HTH cro/C1-type domain-containing protein n=1 Tax=Arcticibacter svalbardensis MN12-7 TaxID=1150600 RepID=R9GWZ7_9SPHI|nr:helix-turn-helix transcriptional regulator [Arcticibacter svalbardensis]EOR96281.1 hypothetical protein ADIARSV_0516 [Arcticibacter svalbardensis MN12-7]
MKIRFSSNLFMVFQAKDKKNKDLNNDNEYFLEQIGRYLRTLRLNAGFSSIESFANTIEMSSTQYGEYEKGKNLTLLTFKRLLLEFNIKVEDWLNTELFTSDNNISTLMERMQQTRIEQVIEQVKFTENITTSHKLTPKEIQRYIDILIYCHQARSRNEIIEKLLKMDDSTNTFKRVAGKLLDYGWIEPTDKKSRNSPVQRYVTTEIGKKVLRINS